MRLDNLEYTADASKVLLPLETFEMMIRVIQSLGATVMWTANYMTEEEKLIWAEADKYVKRADL